MNYITLDLSHDNFFCPATGEQILSSEKFNESATSLRGFWHSEVLEEPTISDEKLQKGWVDFSQRHNEANEGDTPGWEELGTFLKEYPEQNWVVFEITTSGMACGPVSSTVWFVLDLDVDPESLSV